MQVKMWQVKVNGGSTIQCVIKQYVTNTQTTECLYPIFQVILQKPKLEISEYEFLSCFRLYVQNLMDV